MNRIKKMFPFVLTLGFCNQIAASQVERVDRPSEEGKKLLERYKKTAASRKKSGSYTQSALYGAKYGAATGAVGAGIVTFAGAQGNIEMGKSLGSMQQVIGAHIAGAALGAGAGALMAMWDEAYYKNSSPEWLRDITLLEEGNYISPDTVLYLGVPTDLVSLDRERKYKNSWVPEDFFRGTKKRVRKAYLLSSDFKNISSNIATTDKHYELYLMPKDESLIATFIQTYYLIKERFNHIVSFLAIRPTPGITKSPFNSKNMPRIIIGFKEDADKKNIQTLIQALNEKMREFNMSEGLDIQPRYSHKLNSLMYIGYGSPDYKDSKQGQKEYAGKAKTLWQRWFGATDEELAFKKPDLKISL